MKIFRDLNEIFSGIGLGLMYVPAVVAVSQYFSRRLNLATGYLITLHDILFISHLSPPMTDYDLYGSMEGDFSEYFFTSSKIVFLLGICVCGSGVGTFLFAPIASGLVDRFGWRGCNRVTAKVYWNIFRDFTETFSGDGSLLSPLLSLWWRHGS